MVFAMLDEIFSRDFAYASYVYVRDYTGPRRHPGNETLEGKTVLITGGSAGIGKETALDLVRRGARVIITCRDLQKGKAAAEYIREKVQKANVTVKFLDLASFASIRCFAEEIYQKEPHIHILINNAGCVASPSKTEDGFEMHFGVNHLGHFLLTKLLLEKIKASAPARIITVSSAAHMLIKSGFDDLDRSVHPLYGYSWSKLCNILFTRELAKKLEGTGVSTYCLHPGLIRTDLMRDRSAGHFASIYRKIMECVFLTPESGIRTTVYCAVDKSIENDTGLYYCDCTSLQPSKTARDDELAKKLWNTSEKLVGLA